MRFHEEEYGYFIIDESINTYAPILSVNKKDGVIFNALSPNFVIGLESFYKFYTNEDFVLILKTKYAVYPISSTVGKIEDSKEWVARINNFLWDLQKQRGLANIINV